MDATKLFAIEIINKLKELENMKMKADIKQKETGYAMVSSQLISRDKSEFGFIAKIKNPTALFDRCSSLPIPSSEKSCFVIQNGKLVLFADKDKKLLRAEMKDVELVYSNPQYESNSDCCVSHTEFAMICAPLVSRIPPESPDSHHATSYDPDENKANNSIPIEDYDESKYEFLVYYHYPTNYLYSIVLDSKKNFVRLNYLLNNRVYDENQKKSIQL